MAVPKLKASNHTAAQRKLRAKNETYPLIITTEAGTFIVTEAGEPIRVET